MVKTLTISDQDVQNFPADEGELTRRLEKVAEFMPQPAQKEKDANIKFVKEAFTLLKDCGLIKADIVDKLSDKRWCDTSLADHFAMNPLGGVLRQKGLPIWDKTSARYYCGFDDLEVPEDIETAKSHSAKGKSTVAVICQGVTYYVSNDWFSEGKPRPTKKAFYDFLAVATKKVCTDYWNRHQLAAGIREIPMGALESITAATESQKKVDNTEEAKDDAVDAFVPSKSSDNIRLKPLSPQDYEKMSEVDIAYRILTDSGKDNPLFFKDLILEVLDKKNQSVQNEAVAVSEVYTMINMDSRFQHRGEGKWGLVEWNPPEAKRGRGTKKSTTSTNIDSGDTIDNLEK